MAPAESDRAPHRHSDVGSKHLLILTPTRNEARSAALVLAELGDAVRSLESTGWSASMLVVDDGSTDGTSEAIEREAKLRGITAEIVEGPGRGLSRALTFGLSKALERQPTLIATFDFDGQHDASQLTILIDAWERASEVDVVFGTRFAPGATVTGVRGFRKIVSKSAQFAIRQTTAGPRVPSDATTSLRIFTPAVAQAFLDEVPSVGMDGYRLFSWFAVFTSCRFRYAEVPIDFRPRLNGVSKLSTADLLTFVGGLRELRELSKDWVRPREADRDQADRADPRARRAPASQPDGWLTDLLAQRLHGRVVQVGAGDGALVAAITSLPPVGEVIALEDDSSRFEALAGRTRDMPSVEARQGTLSDFFEQADSVLYCGSLEHVDRVLVELRRAAAACRTGGSLVVLAPALEVLYGEADRLAGSYRRFSIGRLRRAVEDVGFEVVEASYLDPLGALRHGVSGRLLRRATSDTPIGGFGGGLAAQISRFVGIGTRRLVGQTILMTARKR